MINRSLTCEVTEVNEEFVVVTCKSDYVLTDRLTMHLPNLEFEGSAVTEEDEQNIVEFAQEHNVDYICVSNTRKASDLEQVKTLMAENNVNCGIIAKIDTNEGLNNYEEILKLADGIMICRADLALEIPTEKVYIAQKWMVELANFHAKPVLVSQQVFTSMCRNTRPSRSEAADVNASVLSGVDCICLDEETSFGDYPANAVTMLSKCIVESEATQDFKKKFSDTKLYNPSPEGSAESIALAAVQSTQELDV